jgi:hypothetical protein
LPDPGGVGTAFIPLVEWGSRFTVYSLQFTVYSTHPRGVGLRELPNEASYRKGGSRRGDVGKPWKALAKLAMMG